MILNYGEFTSNLFVTGQLKRIVSWNLVKETRYPDIQTMTEMPLTAMTVFDRFPPFPSMADHFLTPKIF